jgi:hypothetical protein
MHSEAPRSSGCCCLPSAPNAQQRGDVSHCSEAAVQRAACARTVQSQLDDAATHVRNNNVSECLEARVADAAAREVDHVHSVLPL